MHLETYPIISDQQHKNYEFISQGPRGTIKKAVQYKHLGFNVFNLAFGDWDEKLQQLQDDIRSNNKDRTKVLATVATTVIDFLEHHKHSIIVCKGNTPAKTRLYQMGINSVWPAISHLFEVEGYADDIWQPFSSQKNYEAFSLKNKQKL